MDVSELNRAAECASIHPQIEANDRSAVMVSGPPTGERLDVWFSRHQGGLLSTHLKKSFATYRIAKFTRL